MSKPYPLPLAELLERYGISYSLDTNEAGPYPTKDQLTNFARAAQVLAVEADRKRLTITKNEAGQIVAVTRTDDEGRIIEVLAEAGRKERVEPVAWPDTHRTFKLGDNVRKVRGSQWHGRIVGWYSTELTPEGYAVESDREPGSVQIYPAHALEHTGPDIGWKWTPVETRHNLSVTVGPGGKDD